MPTGNRIGRKVARRREAIGLSQSELARRTGVTPQSIQQLEAGHVRRPGYIVDLARALGCSPEWLASNHLSDARDPFRHEGEKIDPAAPSTPAEPQLDYDDADLMGDIAVALAALHKEEGVPLDLRETAKMALTWYRDILTEAPDPGQYHRLLEAALKRHCKWLRKHRAEILGGPHAGDQ